MGASGKRAARHFGNSELLHPYCLHTAPALSVTIIRLFAVCYSSPFCLSASRYVSALTKRLIGYCTDIRAILFLIGANFRASFRTIFAII